MKFGFKDFVPEAKKVLFFTVTEFESLTKLLLDVNHWIDVNNVNGVNIETVVLPNIDQEEGGNDTTLSTSGEMHSTSFASGIYWKGNIASAWIVHTVSLSNFTTATEPQSEQMPSANVN